MEGDVVRRADVIRRLPGVQTDLGTSDRNLRRHTEKPKGYSDIPIDGIRVGS